MQKNQCAREIEMGAAQLITRLSTATVNERGRMRHEATKRIAHSAKYFSAAWCLQTQKYKASWEQNEYFRKDASK